MDAHYRPLVEAESIVSLVSELRVVRIDRRSRPRGEERRRVLVLTSVRLDR